MATRDRTESGIPLSYASASDDDQSAEDATSHYGLVALSYRDVKIVEMRSVAQVDAIGCGCLMSIVAVDIWNRCESQERLVRVDRKKNVKVFFFKQKTAYEITR